MNFELTIIILLRLQTHLSIEEEKMKAKTSYNPSLVTYTGATQSCIFIV
jgi:hypothetical protein